MGCFHGTPRSEYLAGSNNVVWAAAHNQFFALLAMTTNSPAEQIVARPVTLPAFPNVEPVPGAPPPQGIQTALVYPAQTLAANQAVERQIVLFAGPKEYRTLAHIGAQFQNHADNVMGFGGFFGFCAKPLLLAMNWLHDVTRLGYGWVIVLITVLLRAHFLAVDGGEHALDETDAGAGAGSEGAQGKIQGRRAEAHAKADGALPQSTRSAR